MKLKVEPIIFEKYPEVHISVAVLHNINNAGEHQEITQLLREAEKNVIEEFSGKQISELPFVTPWREAYRTFGAKPSKYPSSIENLIRRVVNGEEIRHVNKLVDIYNVISLRHHLPVGGEDIASLKGDVLLTCAGENEVPVKLLGELEARAPYPGEVIYKDDEGTLCRRWNWKEAERTKLTEQTTHAIIVMEALPPISRELLQSAMNDLLDLVQKYCGGEGEVTIHHGV